MNIPRSDNLNKQNLSFEISVVPITFVNCAPLIVFAHLLNRALSFNFDTSARGVFVGSICVSTAVFTTGSDTLKCS